MNKYKETTQNDADFWLFADGNDGNDGNWMTFIKPGLLFIFNFHVLIQSTIDVDINDTINERTRKMQGNPKPFMSYNSFQLIYKRLQLIMFNPSIYISTNQLIVSSLSFYFQQFKSF